MNLACQAFREIVFCNFVENKFLPTRVPLHVYVVHSAVAILIASGLSSYSCFL